MGFPVSETAIKMSKWKQKNLVDVLRSHESNASDSSHPFAFFEDAGSCLFSVLTLDKLGEEVGLHPPTWKLKLKLLAGCLTQAVLKWAAVDESALLIIYHFHKRLKKYFVQYLFRNCPRFISTISVEAIYSVLKCPALYHLSDLAPPCGSADESLFHFVKSKIPFNHITGSVEPIEIHA